MVGLRLFSVLAQAAAIVVTGLMARELGGGRLAQGTAALAVALSPLPLFQGTEFQYGTFDYLWWVLVAYFTIRLLKTENPRWHAVLVPPSACNTSQSIVMVRSPILLRSTTVRNDRPMSRAISIDLPLYFCADSRCERM